jgi:bla regulator protein BlaR1
MIRHRRVLAMLGSMTIALTSQLLPVMARAQVADQGRRPLIIVDGVVLQGGTSADQDAVLQVLRAAIESIEIVKGPAAVAQFGAGATEGVIIIRLKRELEQSPPGAPGSGSRDPVQIGLSQAAGSPLLVIDGVIIPDQVLKALKPEDIEKIEVFKGNAAVDRFGERAAAGVIYITMRKRMP